MPDNQQPTANPGWPPPPSPDDLFEDVVITVDHRGVIVRGRVVRLWGERVVIDQAGGVFCDGCRRFVPAEDLSGPFNGHRVGLRPKPGAIVASEEPERRRGSAWFG